MSTEEGMKTEFDPFAGYIFPDLLRLQPELLRQETGPAWTVQRGAGNTSTAELSLPLGYVYSTR